MKRFRVLTVAVLAVALAVVGLSAPSADAAKIRKWPHGTIKYYDASLDHEAVAAAAAIWNASGLRIRFVPVTKKKKARLVIVNTARVPQGCGSGYGTLGNPGGRRKAQISILHGGPQDGQQCSSYGQTLTVVHEMGHVLGLTHFDGGCAIMNSSGVNGVAPGLCVTPDEDDYDDAPGRWMCHPLTSSDLLRVQKIYGGNPVAPPADPFCDIVPRMPTAGRLSLTAGDGGYYASMERLPEPGPVPGFLAGDVAHSYPFRYAVYAQSGSCVSRPSYGSPAFQIGDSWSVAPGQTQTEYVDAPASGRVCFTLFAYDALGRPSLRGTDYWVG